MSFSPNNHRLSSKSLPKGFLSPDNGGNEGGAKTIELVGASLNIGFSACGIARADKVDEKNAQAFRTWIQSGKNASMQYMENYEEKRLDPRLLLPGAKSIIVVALNYFPKERLADDQLQFAYYAYGKDYHDVMKAKLQELTSLIEGEHKICCDTVPMLDRYWAYQAGLGWIGKNTNLIIPHAGSFFFLGEIITTATFDTYNSPMPNHCGTCENCLHACPTGALTANGLDANRCLSYLTIENRNAIPDAEAEAMGNYIYGCDRCQLICPHNRFAQATDIEEFSPSEEFLKMTPDDWKQLTEEDYRRLFKGSAVKRAKYAGLKRNIDAALSKD